MRVETLHLPSPDGAVLVRYFPAEGAPRGGVILYMDVFGLRPELDRMAATYAAAGYATFLPDLFHRRAERRFKVIDSAAEPVDPRAIAANDATTLAMSVADTRAILDHAAARPELAGLRFGAVGHCMGGRHALAALASFPDRIFAAASLHGGRLVSDAPDSPHLLLHSLRGVAYFAFAADDPTCPDAHKRIIEATIAASGAHASTEHVPAEHGWTFPERYCHDPHAAAGTMHRVLALFEAEVAQAGAQANSRARAQERP